MDPLASKLAPQLIDCDYLAPHFAASYLLLSSSTRPTDLDTETPSPRALFIESGTAHAVPHLLAALQAQGLSPESVDGLIVTHAHLDHAGGASALLAQLPSTAQLWAHPRAARHLTDPTKLIQSAQAVYGAARFEALYGAIHPIPAQQVISLEDGASWQWGEHHFTALHTRGHANHHLCIHDSAIDALFTGDTFGIAYPALQSPGLFIFPSTSPTDFLAAEARKSIHRLLQTQAQVAYLTHFGAITDLKAAASQLLAHLDFSEALLEKAIHSSEPNEALEAFCIQHETEHFKRRFEVHGLSSNQDAWKLIQTDLRLNAQGIAFAACKARGATRES
jgi:glyoxylase-like metal-dependent hydrolase (beta-lactamase superfamily II)